MVNNKNPKSTKSTQEKDLTSKNNKTNNKIKDTLISKENRSYSTKKTSGGSPLASWFLGPKAEHGALWYELLSYIFQDYIHWRRNYFPNDPVVISRVRRRSHEQWTDLLNANLDSILNALKAHFPFYSPRYIAHMLSEQTLPSVLGYFAGMLYNPNNVTDEAAPVTVNLELQVGRMIAEMLGYDPKRAWAHLCSGGTVANIEALWVARNVQFIPFIIRDYCVQNNVSFYVKTADGQRGLIKDMSDKDLIGFRPNESIFTTRKLAKYLVEEVGKQSSNVISDINKFTRLSEYNPTYRGIHHVIQKIGMNPLIFISATAHYSIKKATNILGYGENCVRFVPVTNDFRMNTDELSKMLESINKNEYIAAVVGVVGTTEEGAVDPIHEIISLREEFSKKNQSFWLHIDAAWGGYIRSLFCGHPEPTQTPRTLEDACNFYIKAIAATENIKIKTANTRKENRKIWWNDIKLYKAFLSIKDADSVTVDPHKLGYIPYPAGIVAFRNGLVTELIVQKAQYISNAKEGIKGIDEVMKIEAVGPFILEGSKPGAAAAACWLAHKTIPLKVNGHGKIMRTTLLNARKLIRYLKHHQYMFLSIDEEFSDVKCKYPFTFVPLYEPDTNIICFITRPMAWNDGKLIPIDIDLKRLNKLNEEIYHALSISSSKGYVRPSYGQPFFVSRTRFEEEQYTFESIKVLLEKQNISMEDYKSQGLFVLRSTVMNPLYYTAEQEGINYLEEFIKYLHSIARTAISKMHKEMQEEQV